MFVDIFSNCRSYLTMKTFIKHSIIILSLLFAWSEDIHALNYSKGIRPECYAIFVDATKQPSSPYMLQASRQMAELAIRHGDKRGETLSYLLPLLYYRAISDHKNMHEAATILRKKARESNDLDIYYEAYDLEARVAMDNGDYSTALKMANQMLEEAKQERYDYGIFLSYRQSANSLKRRRLNDEALKGYNQAISYGQHIPELSLVETYIQMFNVVPKADRPKIVAKAWEHAKSAYDSLIIYSNEAIMAGERMDKNAFYANFSPLRTNNLYPSGLSHAQQTMLKAYDSFFSGNPNEAYRLIGTLTNQSQRLAYSRSFAVRNKDWERAYKLQTEITQYRDSLNAAVQRRDIADFNAQVGKVMLEREVAENKLKLEQSNNLLKIQQQEASLYQQRQMLLLREAEAQKARAEASAQRAEAARLKAESERNKAEARRKSDALLQESRLHDAENEILKSLSYGLGVAGVLLVAIIGILWYFLRRHRLMLEQERRLSAELRKAEEVAVKASKMKDVFIQNMSHEIRTPLNAVMGFSQLLTIPGMPISDEEKEEYGRHIQNNAQLLTMLVDDILNVSDIESGNFNITLRQDHVNDICRSALSVVKYRVPSRVELNFTTEVDDEYTFNTDARRVQQVLVNYLSNACKHTKQGFIHLHCSLIRKPGWIVFSVSDTGEGVPADQAHNIFERFTKLNNFVQGTGLGLNICSSIAKKMNGIVRLDTTYTSGASFLFELPLNDEK